MPHKKEAIFLSSGNKNQSAEQLILSNEGMIVRLVNSFHPKNKDEKSELMQIAYLKLLEANKTFESSVGTKFSSYAWIAIRNELVKRYKKEKICTNYQPIPEELPSPKRPSVWIYISDISDLQKKIIEQKIAGYTFREIAKFVERPLWVVFEEYKKAVEAAKSSGG